MSNYVNTDGGVPDIDYKWKISRAGRYGLMSDSIMNDNAVFLSSEGMNVSSIELSTGKLVWDRSIEDNKVSDISLSNDGKRLCVGCYILNGETGDIECSFYEKLGEMAIGEYSFIVPHKNGFIRDISDSTRKYYFLDNQETERYIDCDLSNVVAGKDGEKVYGWRDGVLCFYDLSKEEITAELSVPMSQDNRPMTSAGFAIIEDVIVLQLNCDTIWCIDANKETIKWKRGPEFIHKNKTPFECLPPNLLSVAPDRIYLAKQMTRNGMFNSYDMKTGDLVWEKEYSGLQSNCIVGDLIFGIKEESVLVAWDRYTGEEVWQAEDTMGAAYHVMAAGNKVVYSSTTGELRCYEWNKPYTSK
jgi:outer membrane protein assembly factor BamB